MAAEGKPVDLGKELLRRLRFSKMDDDNLQDLVKIVIGLQTNGLQNLQVFPRGIPPVVDGLSLQTTVGAASLGNLLSVVLQNTPRVTGVVVFPYGIPNPEIFQVNVTLGNPVEAGGVQAGGAG